MMRPLTTRTLIATASRRSPTKAAAAAFATEHNPSTITTTSIPRPGTAAGVDFDALGFGFTQARCMVEFDWMPDAHAWDGGRLKSEPELTVHAMSSAVHYGCSIFEGAKALHTAQGEICLWNARENARRFSRGAARLMMPVVPEDVFLKAMRLAVANNAEFVPPFGSGGSLYLRPFLFGHGPMLGLAPAPRCKFCVLGIPVGNYYGSSGARPLHALVVDRFDRAAPGGVGSVKAAGNYASDVFPSQWAKSAGYENVLYLDAADRKWIEEFSVANFVGITRGRDGGAAGGTYTTPDSCSILPSITNKMMSVLAKRRGMRVERRRVAVEELSHFDEVGGVGTAVVVSPCASVTHGEEVYEFDPAVPILQSLYEEFVGIQTGQVADTFGWLDPVDVEEHRVSFPEEGARHQTVELGYRPQSSFSSSWEAQEIEA